jgi:RHS repeat-associated protein
MSQNGQLDGYPVTARYSTGEQQTYDALGNFATGLTVDTAKFGTNVTTTRWERSHRYSAGVGRLVAEIGVGANKSYVYDPAGNVEFSMRAVSSTTRGEDRFSYYAANERVRAADYRTRFVGDLQPRQWVFEEYRYDALGRRVWVRSFRECENAEPLSSYEHLECSTSTLRRTVWDGEQELIEIQVPGDASQPSTVLEADNTVFHLPRDAGGMDPNPYFGRVVYVAGLSLDRPIAIVRYNYVDFFFGTPYTDFPPSTWSLFWTERGQLSLAACATGSLACQASGKDMGFDLPAAWAAYNRPQFVRKVFQGTLTHDKEDAARTVYRRERVYDPASGRFTQEDPIGLAGGLNLYGFAGGDPVNFSDPLGLCADLTRSGYASLECAIQDIIGGIKSAPAQLVGLFKTAFTNPVASAVVFGALGEVGGGGRLLFQGTRTAFRTVMRTEWLTGVSGAQGLKLLGRLSKGRVDDIAITAGDGGTITAAITKLIEGGREVTLRTYDRAGVEISTIRRVFDRAGNLVREGVIR